MPYIHETTSAVWHNTLSRSPEGVRMAARCVSDDASPPDSVVEPLRSVFVGGRVDSSFAQADELSFVLMAMLRVEVEKALLGGELKPFDVPQFWRQLTFEYFGNVPESANKVLLRDAHWCNRYMGLFSSYVLGNVLSAVVVASMHKDGIDTEMVMARDETHVIVEWLRPNLYSQGRTTAMAERFTALGFSEWTTEPYIAHITSRYGEF